MRIVIVTNSQGSSAGLPPGLNYPALLRELLGPRFELTAIVISGWTIADIITNLADNVIVIKPDLVIFHVGIVEAAQRILSDREKTVIALLPFGRRITALLHRRRASVLTWRRRLGLISRVVPPQIFEQLLERLASILKSHGISSLFIRMPLFPDGGKSLDHPYVNEDISLYNQMLTRFESYQPEEPVHHSYFQVGTVHFSAEGHRWFAKCLSGEIRRRTAMAA